MPKSILDVRGIGPTTSDVLAKHGLKTANDLANISIEQLAAIPGFSINRATQVIDDARSLVMASKQETPVKKVKAKTKDKKPGKSSKHSDKKEEKKKEKKNKKDSKNNKDKKKDNKAKKSNKKSKKKSKK